MISPIPQHYPQLPLGLEVKDIKDITHLTEEGKGDGEEEGEGAECKKHIYQSLSYLIIPF